MGHILNNFHGGDWYIEHKTKSKWYLFDVDDSNDITQYLWSKDITLCLSWVTQEVACDFLDEMQIPQKSVSVINKLYLRKL